LERLNPDYILLLNNDTMVDKHFLDEMVNFGENNPVVGFLGPKAYYYHNPQLIEFTGGGCYPL
jgi:GT2 family glycosyltransferase